MYVYTTIYWHTLSLKGLQATKLAFNTALVERSAIAKSFVEVRYLLCYSVGHISVALIHAPTLDFYTCTCTGLL